MDRARTGYSADMEGLSDVELLELLEIFEVAIAELRATRDEQVTELIRRLERRRGNVAATLAGRTSLRQADTSTGWASSGVDA